MQTVYFTVLLYLKYSVLCYLLSVLMFYPYNHLQ